MDLREMGWEVVDLIRVAQDKCQSLALVNAVMEFRVQKRLGIS